MPYEIITEQPMSLMVEPQVHPALANSDMTQYGKTLLQYSKAYFKHAKEDFRDPPPDGDFVPHTL